MVLGSDSVQHTWPKLAAPQTQMVNSTTHFRMLRQIVRGYIVMQTEANHPLFIWGQWAGLLQQPLPAVSTIHHRRF